MDYVYRFPVVRGTQAGAEYYIAMVPLKMENFPSNLMQTMWIQEC